MAKQLKLKDMRTLKAGYGKLPDLKSVDFSRDVLFTWNGTTSGVKVPNGDWIPANREGLTFVDATSSAFAQPMDWSKCDVTTFSWQKVLGGEAAHGMLVLSPRAVQRLESYTPAWPLPKVFRLVSGGKLIKGIFEGETINTPSMLCVEDYLDTLAWAESIGGLKALHARADANAKVIWDWIERTPWVDNLAEDKATRSNTSVCIKIVDPAVANALRRGAGASSPRISPRSSRRKAPPSMPAAIAMRLRACASGAARRSRQSDVEALLPWLDWAFAADQGEARVGWVERGTAQRDPTFTTHVGWIVGSLATLDPTYGALPPLTLPTSTPMSKPRVLISDELSPAAVQIFKDRGVDVDVKSGISKDEIEKIIDQYDGLAVRSNTKVTEKLIGVAKRLKVVGRAGIGVDNIDIKAATAKGIIVMNTPFGNSITTAEHAISMMLALARQIPEADRSTQAGKWEKNKFMGVEVYAKTLGVIGCGNIGSIVADRALGLKMKVIAFDPFLSPERAMELGVEKVELDDAAAARGFHHAAHADDREDEEHPRRQVAAEVQEGRAHHQLRARRSRRRAGAGRRAEVGPRRRRGVRRVRRGAGEGERAVRRAQHDLHAASGRCHHRGAGERRAAGRRADVGLSADRARSPTRSTRPTSPRRKRPSCKPWVRLAEQLGLFAGQLTETPIKGDPARVFAARSPSSIASR